MKVVEHLGVVSGGTVVVVESEDMVERIVAGLRKVALSPATGWLGTDGGCRPDRKSTRLNSSHVSQSRMPSSA